MTYIYLNTYPNGYLYVGSHTWNGEGIDPNYYGSSCDGRTKTAEYKKQKAHKHYLKRRANGWDSNDGREEYRATYRRKNKDSIREKKHIAYLSNIDKNREHQKIVSATIWENSITGEQLRWSTLKHKGVMSELLSQGWHKLDN